MDTRSKTVRLGSKIVHVSGEVDMNSAPKLREKLRKTFDQKPVTVVLRLADVPYMDSAGVAVLVEVLQWAKKEKILFVLAEPSAAVRAVIEMARLSRFFVITDDAETSLPGS
ncbi:MAG: STAS domain-containing protein [Planctomycetes bacterium]|nr:STAS domain-containing protein [Planctomycetota bacterium]